MNIFLATFMGFCYGVKRAVNMAKEAGNTGKAYTLGPIIHNPQVVKHLAEKGVSELKEIVETENDTLVIRSHGVGPAVYQEAEDKGWNIVDATCPHVKKVQQEAALLYEQGYPVIIIGEHHHAEVQSIYEWTDSTARIICDLSEAQEIEAMEKAGVVVQTTFNEQAFEDILKTLQAKIPKLVVRRTICSATDQRQQAVKALCGKVDLMIVIGGKNSANTLHLVEICQRSNCEVKHIETKEELSPQWFTSVVSVGVTAGASTPEWIIKEVVAAMEEMTDMQTVAEGSVIRGTVSQVKPDEVWVDIGQKSEAVIAKKDLAYPEPEDANDVAKVGDVLEAVVIQSDETQDLIRLSKVKADRQKAWDNLDSAMEAEQALVIAVTKAVKGGLSVAVEGVHGFVPASQAALHHVEDLSVYEGQVLQALPIEVDREKQRVVLSIRAVLKKEREAKEKEIIAQLKVGDRVKGTVQRLTNFGAFVDIGGVDGLVHVSDLAWNRVKHPSEVVQPGEELELVVLDADPEKRKISLSVKELLPDPWLAQAAQITEGQIAEGTITRLAPFGAFIKLECGLEGLAHISELANHRVATTEEAVQVGQVVQVLVLGVDQNRKRISLSISKAKKKEEANQFKQFNQQNTEKNPTIGDLYRDKLEKQ